MRNFIISVLILIVMALNCQGVKTIDISQESGMAILANLSTNSTNQSTLQSNSSQNLTSRTSSPSTDSAGDLWSWGKIPIGYEVNKNGSLIKLSDQEWRPSI